jgi:hypothetical protein
MPSDMSVGSILLSSFSSLPTTVYNSISKNGNEVFNTEAPDHNAYSQMGRFLVMTKRVQFFKKEPSHVKNHERLPEYQHKFAA